MAATVRQHVQIENGQTTATASPQLAIPAGAAIGDIVCVSLNAANTATTLTTPSGWTLDSGPNVFSSQATWALHKKLVSGDPGSTVTFTLSASRRCSGEATIVQGGTDTGLVFSEVDDSAGGGTTDTPTATGTANGIHVVHFSWGRALATPPPNITVAAPLSQDANSRSATNYGSSPEFSNEAAYELIASAGTVGGDTMNTVDAGVGFNYGWMIPSSGATVSVARQDAGRGSDAASAQLTAAILAAGQDTGQGSDAAGVQLFATVAVARQDAGRGSDTVNAQILAPPPAKPPTQHVWSAFSRTPGYALDLALPILSARFVRRHLGVPTAKLVTPYTEARYASLQPDCGVELYRDGRQEFTGLVSALELEWDEETGRKLITVEAEGDEATLADSLVFPDPLRAADDQTVNDYWRTRNGAGTATAKTASAAMLQLISDTVGPTARSDRQIPGLTLGADPAVGVSRIWSALFNSEGNALGTLTAISVASGANLGLRVTSSTGALTVTVVQPRDLASSVRFSADLRNLVGFKHRIERPKVTHALAAGQGDLHLRLRKLVVTTDAFALSWGRRIWSYIDRRDTADTAELTDAASDALGEGVPTVNLTVTLRDTAGARYGRDYDLGDKVTVYVGMPGQTKVATVADVIREIAFDVNANGAEKITPAIGSYDAKALIPTPTQQQLTRVGRRLAGLIARQ